MLRSTTVLRHTRTCLRSQFTRAYSTETPSNEATEGGYPHRANQTSAQIRTAAFPRSMRDALAILRAVERKYGQIKEFRFLRDFDAPTNYQSIINVVFHDIASWQRIPTPSETLEIQLLPENSRPGGPSYSDIEDFLKPERYDSLGSSDSTFSSTKPADDQNIEMEQYSRGVSRTINVRVQRMEKDLHAMGHRTHFNMRSDREAIARQMLNWGGFHDFTPLEKSTALPEEHFFNSTAIDHYRMRFCMRRASKYLGVPNPYEYSDNTLSNSSSMTAASNDQNTKPEWEPIPEHDNIENKETTKSPTSSEAVVPSDADVLLKMPEPMSGKIDTSSAVALDIPSNKNEAPERLSTEAGPELSVNSVNESIPDPNLSDTPTSTTSAMVEDQLRAARAIARQARKIERKPKSAKQLPVQQSAKTSSSDSILEDEVEGVEKDVSTVESGAVGQPTKEELKHEDGVAGSRFKNIFKGIF